jgi:hypothetical protein
MNECLAKMILNRFNQVRMVCEPLAAGSDSFPWNQSPICRPWVAIETNSGKFGMASP